MTIALKLGLWSLVASKYSKNKPAMRKGMFAKTLSAERFFLSKLSLAEHHFAKCLFEPYSSEQPSSVACQVTSVNKKSTKHF